MQMQSNFIEALAITLIDEDDYEQAIEILKHATGRENDGDQS